jgi:hypothetical protein
LDAISGEVSGATARIRDIAATDTVAARSVGEVFCDYNLHDQRLGDPRKPRP